VVERAIDRPQAKGNLHIGNQGREVRPRRVRFSYQDLLKNKFEIGPD
jgi:hypothetical protein